MDGKDITPQFSLDEIDHHELLDVLASRYTTSWRVSKHAITFPAAANYKIKLQISHGEVERVFAGTALADADPPSRSLSLLPSLPSAPSGLDCGIADT